MIEFFKGRRRKAGGVALVMALILIAGWTSSIVVIGQWEFLKGDYEYQCLFSSRGYIAWLRLTPDSSSAKIRTRNPDMFSPEAKFDVAAPIMAQMAGDGGFQGEGTYEWKIGCCGSGIGEICFNKGSSRAVRASMWRTPYWSIATPLILLSAYLLLWKPRGPSRGTQSAENW